MSLETFSDETVSDSLMPYTGRVTMSSGILEKVPPRILLGVSVVFAYNFYIFSLNFQSFDFVVPSEPPYRLLNSIRLVFCLLI